MPAVRLKEFVAVSKSQKPFDLIHSDTVRSNQKFDPLCHRGWQSFAGLPTTRVARNSIITIIVCIPSLLYFHLLPVCLPGYPLVVVAMMKKKSR